MVEMRYANTDVLTLLAVPITEVLVGLGYSDKHVKDMYYSPFRNETSPSFHINHRCNIWYDHGAGIGGGVMDLVKLLLHCSSKEAMKFLSDIKGLIPDIAERPAPAVPSEKSSMIVVMKTCSPVVNSTLLQYSSVRGISNDILNRYCKEVVYEVKGKRNHQFHAIGFPNCEGGWVLRSSRYKRCTGNAPTWIDVNGDYSMRRSSSTLCVFEGFMDFLSWRMIEDGKPAECDCCVLNSVNNLGKIISKAMDYECVRCYMDNDEAGLKAFSQLAQVLEITDVSISDMSGLYEGYNDLNEMLMNNRTHFNT